jgi:mannose-6-phosphate isomerase-like protein (cupin superfamily)/GNAT superfamily N-acetyltransferase
VRVLLGLAGGTMAHFELPAGEVSRPVAHRTVEELWLILSGKGELWRKQATREEFVALEPGVCVSLPRGTHFQFRAAAADALTLVAATIPRWPGDGEAEFVPGPWRSSLTQQHDSIASDRAFAATPGSAPGGHGEGHEPAKTFTISTHDGHPTEEASLVDRGLGEANDAAAPLHEVRPLSCFARSESRKVVGGAIGRRWGPCCELQQLWVERSYRRRGIGARLVRAFEARAREHGCSSFYLETFSFQSPGLYRSLGYSVAHEHKLYPHGIIKYLMVKLDQAANP